MIRDITGPFKATYKESAARRISLAEKLRRLPLSFFAKRDLADLTSTIMSDAEVMEYAGSHMIPQFYGSIVSTLIISVGLFFFRACSVSLQMRKRNYN